MKPAILKPGTTSNQGVLNDYNKLINENFLETKRLYKSYIACIEQSGTDNPIADVIENNLGSNVVITRTTTGGYEVTSPEIEITPLNKIWVIPQRVSIPIIDLFTSYDEDLLKTSIIIQSKVGSVLTDDIIKNQFIEIRIYS